MVVLIMERVPTSLKGEITRWLLELKSGVFVGNISAIVREKLWTKVCAKSNGGASIILWTCQCEQGFQMEFWGSVSRVVTQWEGLQLMTKPEKP